MHDTNNCPNPDSYSLETKINQLLDQMTLPEKVGQMMQVPANGEVVGDPYEALATMHVGSFLHVTGDAINRLQEAAAKTRLGIPLLYGVDAIHGHCFEEGTTVYPSQLSMSASWNPDLLETMAQQAAREIAAGGMHWTFSPVFCLGRDPRWGRIDETFGEDGFLAGQLGAAMVRGYQAGGLDHPESVLACPKHFAAYGESTGGRDSYEAEVSKRKMRSHFLPAFEEAVKSGALSVMAGYQAIDGLPCSANPWLLRTVLRDEWGFEGIVLTDWNNIGNLKVAQRVAVDDKEAAFLAIRAGNDMIMSTPSFYQCALDLVAEGRIDEREIDEAVRNVLRIKFRLGLFDGKRHYDPKARIHTFQRPDHLETALQASRESIVLLENNGLLPLQKRLRIVLTGPNADDHRNQLGDWSFGSGGLRESNRTIHKADTITVLKALRQRADIGDATLTYVQGCDIFGEAEDIDDAVAAAGDADVVVCCVGDNPTLQAGEFRDRSNLCLSGHQQALLEALKQTGKPLVVVMIQSKPLVVPWIKHNADAVLAPFNPGMFGGQAIVETLFGELNPSGKLTMSWPRSEGQLPVYYNQYEGWHAWDCAHWSTSRYHDSEAGPLWAFGEGKSFSRIEYGKPAIERERFRIGESVRVRVELTNADGPDAIEIVQVYVHDRASSVTVPVLKLGGFTRVKVPAGQSVTATILLEPDAFALIDAHENKRVEAGEFHLHVGPSAKYSEHQVVGLVMEASDV